MLVVLTHMFICIKGIVFLQSKNICGNYVNSHDFHFSILSGSADTSYSEE
jgi:hypothetical protein